jgi:hypothetical protein
MKETRYRDRGAIWGAATGGMAMALVVASASSAAAEDRLQFRFDPPPGTSFVQQVKTTMDRRMGPMGTATDVHLSRTLVTIDRTTDGFLLTARPLSSRLTRDGKEVRDPVTEALQDIVVKYRLDSDGRLVSVSGYEKLNERLQKRLPPKVFAAVSRMVNPRVLKAKELEEWNARVGDFAGKRFTIGEVLTAEKKFKLPSGQDAVFHSTTKIVERAPIPGGNGVRVRFEYGSDPGRASGTPSKKPSARAKKKGGGEAGVSPEEGITITGKGERVIDPKTMLIYSEKLTRTMKMMVEVPGAGRVPATTRETREYVYEYPEVAGKGLSGGKRVTVPVKVRKK